MRGLGFVCANDTGLVLASVSIQKTKASPPKLGVDNSGIHFPRPVIFFTVVL